MLPILIIGGIAAAALLSGCSRSNSESSSNSNPTPSAPPEDHSHHHLATTPAPSSSAAAGPYRYQSSFSLADATREYLDLCEVLFNQRDRSACDGIRASNAMTETPSNSRGLNAYYRGILAGEPGYSFEYADQRAPWSPRMHGLQAASLYLAGHGNCLTRSPNADACVKLNDGRDIPSRFDFMDDYYNLLGTFFFLQANGSTIDQGGHCRLVAATLGAEDRPFCHAFAIHNLVLTPISQRLRGVDPEVHLQPLGLATSECRAH